jgi:MoaA/NifB/PqqE/SkfB family radical SAM enzyme
MAVTALGDHALTSGTLMLHLLGRCNLKCMHCYMEGAPSQREELPLPLVLAAISDCTRLGVTNLYLTGGEALLYRGLFPTLEACAGIPGLSVTLCTNGMLVKAGHAAPLRDLGIDVNVSVDGEEGFHDHFRRRRGAFRATEAGIRTLVEARVPVAIVYGIPFPEVYEVSTVFGNVAVAGQTTG